MEYRFEAQEEQPWWQSRCSCYCFLSVNDLTKHFFSKYVARTGASFWHLRSVGLSNFNTTYRKHIEPLGFPLSPIPRFSFGVGSLKHAFRSLCSHPGPSLEGLGNCASMHTIGRLALRLHMGSCCTLIFLSTLVPACFWSCASHNNTLFFSACHKTTVPTSSTDDLGGLSIKSSAMTIGFDFWHGRLSF